MSISRFDVARNMNLIEIINRVFSFMQPDCRSLFHSSEITQRTGGVQSTLNRIEALPNRFGGISRMLSRNVMIGPTVRSDMWRSGWKKLGNAVHCVIFQRADPFFVGIFEKWLSVRSCCQGFSSQAESVARNEAVRDWFRVSAALAKRLSTCQAKPSIRL
jgi:hypothetical protein